MTSENNPLKMTKYDRRQLLMRRCISYCFFAIATILSACQQPTKSSDIGLKFHKLTCNYQENPIVIDGFEPQFSWILHATGYNRSQSAYTILVASSPEILENNEGDFWNSEKQVSNQSAYHVYKGKALQPATKYWWKVKIWDESENPSQWSTPQTFETGLATNSNWENAKWITVPEDTRTSEHRFRDFKNSKAKDTSKVSSFPTGYFRNTFTAAKPIKSARAYIAGLGYYELYINGQKVGDHVLDPAPTNYDKQAFYVVLSPKTQLQEGKNTIAVVLGNGFYGQNLAFRRDPESEKSIAYGPPAVRMLLDIVYKDGTSQQITTDKDWKTVSGPIVFDNVYGGEVYDANFEIPNWNTNNYDDSKDKNVKITNPIVGKLRPQVLPPIRKLKTLKPIAITKADNGNWIVDFGQNIAGWVRLGVEEQKGSKIQLQLVEALKRTGNAIFLGSTGGGASGLSQQLTYICRSSGRENWEPRFTYHGFRYAEISGLSKKPKPEDINAILVGSDVTETGHFDCSNPQLNKMNEISKWTVIDNLHGIPEDCPQREKCGWLGDAHATAEYILYNYDIATFYQKYMEDIRTQFRKVKGGMNKDTYKVPTMIAPGKRTSTIAKLDWGIATIYLPWYHYLYYGDQSIVSEYYEDMKQLTQYYLSFKNETGIIDNGMGDWCPPRWDRKRNPSAMECHPVISATAYFYDILKVMKEFSILMNDTNYKTFLNNEIQSLKKSFNATYLTEIPSTKHQWYGSQTATVMALQFGLVPDAKRQNILNGLIYDINVTHGGHHSVGIHGNRYLYTVLSKLGQTELGYSLLTNPEFPSQTFIMNSGFTTWPERQWDWSSGIEFSNSLNHPMHSGFAAYFYESIGGIQPVTKKPGFKEFTVQPIYPKDITTANVKITTPYGEIKNDWKIENKQFTMNLSVPFNTTAIIPLSDQEIASLKINNESAKKYIKNPSTKNTGNIRLESGTYTLSYSKK